MTDQQAPSISRQASEELFQRLSTNAQLNIGGTSSQSTSRVNSVNSELYQVLNRLSRSQANTPIFMVGRFRYALLAVVGSLI